MKGSGTGQAPAERFNRLHLHPGADQHFRAIFGIPQRQQGLQSPRPFQTAGRPTAGQHRIYPQPGGGSIDFRRITGYINAAMQRCRSVATSLQQPRHSRFCQRPLRCQGTDHKAIRAILTQVADLSTQQIDLLLFIEEIPRSGAHQATYRQRTTGLDLLQQLAVGG